MDKGGIGCRDGIYLNPGLRARLFQVFEASKWQARRNPVCVGRGMELGIMQALQG